MTRRCPAGGVCAGVGTCSEAGGAIPTSCPGDGGGGGTSGRAVTGVDWPDEPASIDPGVASGVVRSSDAAAAVSATLDCASGDDWPEALSLVPDDSD